ncbi:hypothetical protein E2C01_026308 [Portunus trituberculatus]|uniref:Uncharacterized protein n=1 Tax=Portunus trituberculatus TaxID=210409 RepID=A0A5B7EF33_PORTR|nr:hypothetical protein [Portunus trituberculatus]
MAKSPVRRFSVLVRLMQFLGIFPYVWPNSPPDASPRQSVALCLWVLLLQLMYLGLGSFYTAVLFDKVHLNYLGDLLQLCIDIFCLLSSSVMMFLMIIYGRHLANLLPRLEEALDEAVKLHMNSWITSKFKTFTLTLGIASLSLCVFTVYTRTPELYMIPIVIMRETAVNFLYVLQMGLFLPILYFLSTFVNHLTRDAVTSTQTTELQPWGASPRVKDEAWCQQKMSQLLHLEHRLRKVQAIKSLLLDFFGWPLVVAMLQSLIIIIAGFYNFTRINGRSYELLSMTMSCFFTLHLIAVVAENFTKKAISGVRGSAPGLQRPFVSPAPQGPGKKAAG